METHSKLKVKNISVGYNGKTLISEICFECQPGKIITLIGPNGSGKSTILKSITRHLSLVSGAVYIDGKNIKEMSNRTIAQTMAVMMTDRVKPELMTCFEVVATARYPYTGGFGLLTEKDKGIVRECLNRVHALDLSEKNFSAISDGQRQRILLARALAQEPEIIVLDEPTSFLDIKHKIELLEILKQMAREQNIAVLMSLHEIDLADKISDVVICVNGKNITAIGEPQDIITDTMINTLYDLKRGSYSALMGSIEMDKVVTKPKVFVIGGLGYASPFYRQLQRKNIGFSTGILFENDVDFFVAKALSPNIISTAAFSPVSEKLIAEAKLSVDAVPFVLDCSCPIGEFNKCNQELLDYAKFTGKQIITTTEEVNCIK